jgi:hypothetical protein
MTDHSAWRVRGDGQLAAGPSARRIGATHAEAANGESRELVEGPVGVCGVGTEHGGFEHRASPEDKAFEAHLPDQRDRLDDRWDELFTVHHPYAALTRELAAALVESGFDPQHCVPNHTAAGICLTPTTDGVTIAWAKHDSQAQDPRAGNTTYEEIQQTMNYALADVLTALGFEVDGLGQGSAHIVKGRSYHQ